MSPQLMTARSAPGAQRGSMLIEVLISVLLLSVSVLGLVRVLANTMQDSGELEYRSVASTVADESLGLIWVGDKTDLEAFEVEDEEVAQLPAGLRTIEVDGNVVTVTVSWQAPSAASRSRHLVTATITENGP